MGDQQPRGRTPGLDKRRAAMVVAVPALLLVGLATRPWATGTGGDVLGSGTVEVAGASASPGAVGLAVITIVSLLALTTGGRVIRAAASFVIVLAAAGTLVLVLLAALRPREVVAGALASELARTTTPDATGATTAWAWSGLVVAGLLLLGAVAAAASSRRWAGLSSRYERGDRAGSGPRGEVRTTWDELTEGQDPTLRDDPGRT